MDSVAQIEGIRNIRFDGYSPEDLAKEVEKFSTPSPGYWDKSNASTVALNAVADSLAEADSTLRSALNNLKVSWISKSGEKTARVFTEVTGGQTQGFAKLANVLLEDAAENVYSQTDKFGTTAKKLPPVEELLRGTSGTDPIDDVLSIVDIETDNAKEVNAGNAARQNAINVLNQYASESADLLAKAKPLPQAESLHLTNPPDSLEPHPLSKSSSVPGTNPSGDYAVAAGESLSAIAKKLNVEGGWKKLYELNEEYIKDPNKLAVGQKIVTTDESE